MLNARLVPIGSSVKVVSTDLMNYTQMHQFGLLQNKVGTVENRRLGWSRQELKVRFPGPRRVKWIPGSLLNLN